MTLPHEDIEKALKWVDKLIQTDGYVFRAGYGRILAAAYRQEKEKRERAEADLKELKEVAWKHYCIGYPAYDIKGVCGVCEYLITNKITKENA